MNRGRSSLGAASAHARCFGPPAALPVSCFADPAQQGQVTQQGGFYRFDMNFADPACPSGGSYVFEVPAPPSSNFIAGASALIPPTPEWHRRVLRTEPALAGVSDAVPVTIDASAAKRSRPNSLRPLRCRRVRQPSPPPPPAPAPGQQRPRAWAAARSSTTTSRSTSTCSGALSIYKTTPMKNVGRGQLVPNKIHRPNRCPHLLGLQLRDVRAVDSYPVGFRDAAGLRARLPDNVHAEPTQNGPRADLERAVALGTSDEHVLITLLLAVGAGVGEGEFVNDAHACGTGSPIVRCRAMPRPPCASRPIRPSTAPMSSARSTTCPPSRSPGPGREAASGGVRLVTRARPGRPPPTSSGRLPHHLRGGAERRPLE